MAGCSSLPSIAARQRREAVSDSEDECCWICLCGESGGPLTRPCKCPRVCHRECIATWQLTNYGRREESNCRFCGDRLPQLWKPDAAQQDPSTEEQGRTVAPVMAVRYNGPEGIREFKMRVRPGPEGLAMFKAHLKAQLGISIGPEFDVTFECQMPATGSLLTLSGLNAYGAATHCAALLAASKSSSPSAAPAHATDPAAALQPCSAVPPSSTRVSDSGLRRRACQTGYVQAAPLPCLVSDAAWAAAPPPVSERASSSSQSHASWRHLGTDPGHRRARNHRRSGARTALGLVTAGEASSDRSADDADEDITDELLDELLPIGPRGIALVDEDDDDLDLAVSDRAWRRRHGAAEPVPHATHGSRTLAAGPERPTSPLTAASLQAARPASSGYLRGAPLRLSSSMEKALLGTSGMAAAAPYGAPPGIAAGGAVSGVVLPPVERAMGASSRRSSASVLPPAAICCPGAAAAGLQRQGTASRSPRGMLPAPHAPWWGPDAVATQVGSQRVGREQPQDAQVLSVKQRLPDVLKATAKRTVTSLLRTLRRGKE